MLLSFPCARWIDAARAGCIAFATLALPALAANLTIGLGADVTALDPHYHNVTPNNNVAGHLFGYLVQRNEKSQLEPGPRDGVEDRRSADVGIQAAQGREIP